MQRSRCILRHCSVLYVRFVPQDLRALNLDLFTLPSVLTFYENDNFNRIMTVLEKIIFFHVKTVSYPSEKTFYDFITKKAIMEKKDDITNK